MGTPLAGRRLDAGIALAMIATAISLALDLERRPARDYRSARMITSISSATLRRWSSTSPERMACSTQWPT